MTPLSVKRSLVEVHLQHQILLTDLHRKVYVVLMKQTKEFYNLILELKGYKRNSVEVLYPVTESSLTILFF